MESAQNCGFFSFSLSHLLIRSFSSSNSLARSFHFLHWFFVSSAKAGREISFSLLFAVIHRYFKKLKRHHFFYIFFSHDLSIAPFELWCTAYKINEKDDVSDLLKSHPAPTRWIHSSKSRLEPSPMNSYWKMLISSQMLFALN